jgi:hypothetical protein
MVWLFEPDWAIETAFVIIRLFELLLQLGVQRLT